MTRAQSLILLIEAQTCSAFLKLSGVELKTFYKNLDVVLKYVFASAGGSPFSLDQTLESFKNISKVCGISSKKKKVIRLWRFGNYLDTFNKPSQQLEKFREYVIQDKKIIIDRPFLSGTTPEHIKGVLRTFFKSKTELSGGIVTQGKYVTHDVTLILDWLSRNWKTVLNKAKREKINFLPSNTFLTKQSNPSVFLKIVNREKEVLFVFPKNSVQVSLDGHPKYPVVFSSSNSQIENLFKKYGTHISVGTYGFSRDNSIKLYNDLVVMF